MGETSSFVKSFAAAGVTVYLLQCLLFSTLLLHSGKRWQLVDAVLDYIPPKQAAVRSTSLPVRYPSTVLFSSKDNTRRKIRELFTAHPDAVFYAERCQYFTYDGFPGGPPPGSQLKNFFQGDYWKQAYTSKALKVYWVVDTTTQLPFLPPTEGKLVFEDRFERLRIWEGDFAAGYRFRVEK
jgi:hypothetical protein